MNYLLGVPDFLFQVADDLAGVLDLLVLATDGVPRILHLPLQVLILPDQVLEEQVIVLGDGPHLYIQTFWAGPQMWTTLLEQVHYVYITYYFSR